MSIAKKRKNNIRTIRHFNTITDALSSWNHRGYRITSAKYLDSKFVVMAVHKKKGSVVVSGRTLDSTISKLQNRIDYMSLN